MLLILPCEECDQRELAREGCPPDVFLSLREGGGIGIVLSIPLAEIEQYEQADDTFRVRGSIVNDWLWQQYPRQPASPKPTHPAPIDTNWMARLREASKSTRRQAC